MEKLRLSFIIFYLAGCVSSLDQTLVNMAKGPEVVEAVCSKIESSCIFDYDKLLLRRIAHQETNDGLDPKTYREGYNGGIWQVDESMFRELQLNADACDLYNDIKQHFNIDWRDVQWSDLRKPFYSGLAARLILHLSKINIGGSVPAQARLWRKYYRTDGDEEAFIKKINGFRNECESRAVDVVFMVDDSINVGADNFNLTKTFLLEVATHLNIGSDPVTDARLSVITFSNPLTPVFYLNTYPAKQLHLRAIETMVYGKGDVTNINLVLQYLRLLAFSPALGGREGVPKIGIIVTNGESNNYFQTLKESLELTQTDVIIMAVGIGAKINKAELRAITSHPSCLNLFLINSFEDFQHIIDLIKEQICKVPLVINKDTKTIVPRLGQIPCKVILPSKGTTFEISATENTTIYFYDKSVPSPLFYEHMVVTGSNSPSVVYIPNNSNLDFKGSYAYCLIEGHPEKQSRVHIKPCPGNCDPCTTANCLDNQICVNDFEFGYKCINKRTSASGYDCMKNNPCTPENARQNSFYFPYTDQRKFVQCSEWGQCYVMPCPKGQLWHEKLLTCIPLMWYERGII